MNKTQSLSSIRPLSLHMLKESDPNYITKYGSQATKYAQCQTYDQTVDFKSIKQKKANHSFVTIISLKKIPKNKTTPSASQHWDMRFNPTTKYQRTLLRLDSILSSKVLLPNLKDQIYALRQSNLPKSPMAGVDNEFPIIHSSWKNKFIQEQPRQLNRTIVCNKTEEIIEKQQTSQSLFIICSQLVELKKLKIHQMDINQFNNYSKDIYRRRQRTLEYLQSELQLSAEYRFIFLFNEQPIQFFEEIPQGCNIVFIGKTLKCEFWNTLFGIHKVSTKNRETSLNRILSTFSQTQQVVDIYSILQQRQKFMSCIRTNQEELDSSLVVPTFNLTSNYYKSKNQIICEKDIDNKTTEIQKLEVDVMNEKYYDDNEVDFSLKYKTISPRTLQVLINTNMKKPNNRSSDMIRLDDHNEYCRKKLQNFNKIQQNKNKYFDVNRCIQQNLPLMVIKNIPEQLLKTDFTRQELHEVFSRYRALLSMECSNMKGMDASMLPEGLTFPYFCAGLQELQMVSIGVCEHLFNLFSTKKILNFDSFSKVINLIKAKMNNGKIKLIQKLMDTNQNGFLCFSEIQDRCLQMMATILINDDSELSITKMSDYITRSIFDAVQVSYEAEIPIDKIRILIESDSSESQVLIMMCCGDFILK